jgi:hypothetical protein
MDNTQTMYPASAPIPDGGAQTSADDASASTMYGTPVASTMVHTSQRGGPGMPVGGKQANPYGLVSPKTSPAAHPQFPQQDIPNIADYIQMRAAEDKKTTLSSLTPDEILGYTDEYANHFGVASYESQGNKMDKSQADALVARAKMSVTKNMPALKAHFANIDNAGKAGAPAPEPSALDTAGAAVKSLAGASGDVDYPSGPAYALDNPLTRGLAQAGNQALTGVEHAAAHPMATAEGVANTLIGLTPVGKLLQTTHPEVAQWLTQNRDDPAVAEFVDKNFTNKLTGQPFQKEAAQLETPASANPAEAVTQLGSNLAGTLAIAGAGGKGANLLKEGAAASKAGAAATFGATSGENQIAQKEAQTGKPIAPAQQGDMIMSAVATGALPASVGSGLIRKLISGAAIGTGANALSNQAAGNPLMQGGGTAALLGAGLSMLPHGGAPEVKPGATPEAKPGETPPPAAGAAPTKPATPAQGKAYSEASAAVLAHPDYAVKPGTPEETAQPTLVSALEDFEGKLHASGETFTPEQNHQAMTQFEQEWRAKYSVPQPASEAPAAPAAEAKPPVQEGQAPSPAEAAAAVATPAEGASEPPNAVETPPVETGLEPGAAREAAQEGVLSHGEVREAAPAAEPVPLRELVTQNGVDTRLPFGVTERVATELRASLGRDPTPQEINTHAKMILDTAGVDMANLHKREALGKLLEEDGGKIPTREEIAAKADEMKDDLKKGSAQKAVTSRIVEFQNRKAAREINKTDLRTNPLQKELPLGPTAPKLELTHGLTDEEVNVLKGDKAKEKVANDKAKADNAQMRAEREKAVAEEAKKQGLRDVLKKTEPKKAEAANQEGEAAQEDPNKEQPAFYRVRKAGTKDKFGEPVTGRSRADIQDELTNGVPGKIKGLGKEVVTALQKRFVKVVQSMDQLPQEAIDEYNKHPEAGAVKGYYDPKNDVSWLVADHLEPGEAIPTIIHEVGAHYGLRRMLLPSTYNALERYVEATRHLDTPDGRELAKAYADAQAAQVHPKNAINETMATMITNRGTQAGSIWARALAQLKAFLYNKLGHILPEKWANKLINNDTIMELARGALKWTSNKDMNVALRHTEEPIVDHPGMFSRAPKSVDEIQRAWRVKPEEQEVAPEHKAFEQTAFQRFTTHLADTLKPLQHYAEQMAKKGTPLDPKADMRGAFVRLVGQKKHITDTQYHAVVEPVENKAVEIMKRLGMKDPEKFWDAFIQYTGAKHAIEDNRRGELENVKLSDAAQAERAKLKLAVHNGSMKPDEYMAKLKDIVNAPGARIEKNVPPLSGVPNVMAHELAARAAKVVPEAELEEMNAALNPAREQDIQNGLESKKYTPNDVNVLRAYNSKYYLPNSGFADEAQLPGGGSRPFGAFTNEASYQAGRTTLSANPLDNFIRQLRRSGEDIANNEATKALYNAAIAKGNTLGATIKTYNMEKLVQDALAGGGKLSDVQKVFKDPNSVIHNDGKFRHVITYPEDSPVLKAVKESQQAPEVGPVIKAVGRGTSLLARLYAGLNPTFAVVTSLARDSTAYPTMLMADGKYAATARYAKNYAGFGGPLGAWKTFLGGDNIFGKSLGEIQDYADKHPNSFAGWYTDLSKHGGAFNFKDELSEIRKSNDLVEKMQQDGKNKLLTLDPRQWWKNFKQLQDSMATGSLMIGRTSVYKSLVEGGMSRDKAAQYTKELTNFQQRSKTTDVANNLYAFSRVGMASADRVAQFFKNEDGSFNYKAAARMVGIGAAYSMVAYQTLINSMGEDKAKKLSLDALSKNFIIPNGTDKPYQLPMGLGLPRLIFGAGMAATRFAHGHNTLKEAAESYKNTVMENLSPLHPIQPEAGANARTQAEDLLTALIPTLGRPVAEVGLNQNAFGSPITTEAKNGRFASDSGKINTPTEWKTLAKGIRELGGPDVFPEQLQYMVNQYGGGALGMFLRSMKNERLEELGKPPNLLESIAPQLENRDIEFSSYNDARRARAPLQDAAKEAASLKSDNKPIPAALQKQADEEKKFESAAREHGAELKRVQDNKLLSAAGKASQMAAINSKYQHTQEQLASEAKRLGQ